MTHSLEGCSEIHTDEKSLEKALGHAVCSIENVCLSKGLVTRTCKLLFVYGGHMAGYMDGVERMFMALA